MVRLPTCIGHSAVSAKRKAESTTDSFRIVSLIAPRPSLPTTPPLRYGVKEAVVPTWRGRRELPGSLFSRAARGAGTGVGPDPDGLHVDELANAELRQLAA